MILHSVLWLLILDVGGTWFTTQVCGRIRHFVLQLEQDYYCSGLGRFTHLLTISAKCKLRCSPLRLTPPLAAWERTARRFPASPMWSCSGSECIVHRCLPGYVPAFDGASCIRKHSISQSQLADPEDVPARVFGLEHVPHGMN